MARRRSVPVLFRCRRAFTFQGKQVKQGDVIDVAALPDSKVFAMESAAYGLRVTGTDGASGGGTKRGGGGTPRTVPSATV